MGVCLASEHEQYIGIGLQKWRKQLPKKEKKRKKKKKGVRLENELENVPLVAD